MSALLDLAGLYMDWLALVGLATPLPFGCAALADVPQYTHPKPWVHLTFSEKRRALRSHVIANCGTEAWVAATLCTKGKRIHLSYGCLKLFLHVPSRFRVNECNLMRLVKQRA